MSAALVSAVPYVVAVDTREQRPWDFGPVPTVRATLKSGDYSLVGFEDRIAIERKERGDFLACCTGSRDRFVRELERLSSFDRAAVIVEACVWEVWEGSRFSGASPASIMGSAAAFWLDFGVPVFFIGSREHSADFAGRLLRKWHERQVSK